MEKEGLPLYLWRNDVRVSPSRKLVVFRFSENGKGEDKIKANTNVELFVTSRSNRPSLCNREHR